MQKETCLDCGNLLPADYNICPVCGWDRDYKSPKEHPIPDELLNSLTDDIIPAQYIDC